MDRTNRNRAAVLVLALATLVLGVLTRAGTGAPHPEALNFSAPPSQVAFEGRLDRAAVLRGGDGVVRMQVVMRAEERPHGAPPRVPTDLVVVLDRSGSMNGRKIEHARAAIRELIARLGGDDRFGLVTYSNGAALEIPLARATAQARTDWLRAVDAITPQGATNLSAGLELGLERVEARAEADRVPRVILISDGLANRGDSSVRGLTVRASRAARGEYTLSAVGVGLNFNEELMSSIADAGTGNYYYLESAEDLSHVFALEFGAARSTVASALELRIEPAAGVRVLDAAGYPLEVRESEVVVRPGSLFAGQERRIWLTLAVGGDALGAHELGRFALAYTDGGRRREVSFAANPVVTRVAGERDYLLAVDRPQFEQAVKQEGYGRLQQKVSGYVRRGLFNEADSAIDAFVESHEELNRALGSEAVAEEIARARELKRDAKGAASSPAKQNAFGKKKGYEARKMRRMGKGDPK
jgi:Ca-activated chloride channel family protein